jgi:hypothetical protein
LESNDQTLDIGELINDFDGDDIDVLPVDNNLFSDELSKDDLELAGLVLELVKNPQDYSILDQL